MEKRSRKDIDELMAGFEQICRARGLRITHQRSEIFREMAQAPGHPSVEKIYNKIRRRLKTISLDTIYRTILTFENHGLIKRLQFYDSAARFDINISVHHHLVCTSCKKVEDFYWPEFDSMKLPKSTKGWPEIHSRNVEVLGLCRECQTGTKDRQAS